MYEQGHSLKEISDKLGIKYETLKSWRRRDNWDAHGAPVTTAPKKVHPNPKDKAIASVIENKSLTDKQRLFCLYYSRSFNATRSYQKAYGCDYLTACASGPRLLANVRVRDEVTKLKEQRYAQALLQPEDVFQKYMDIAFSDLTDYLEWGQEEVPVMAMYGPVVLTDPDTGEKTPLMKSVNVVRFRGSEEVDGSIISEVKQGKDGASIKLADRMKALEWLADHLDLATEEQRVKIDQIKAATTRITGAGNDQQANDQIQAIADLINNPQPERKLSDIFTKEADADDTLCAADDATD